MPVSHVDGAVEEHLFDKKGHVGLVDVWKSLDDPIPKRYLKKKKEF